MSSNIGLVPTWEDFESLPQVRAYVLEALRWRPPVPFGERIVERADDEINCTFLQEFHTVPLRILSGYVAHHPANGIPVLNGAI